MVQPCSTKTHTRCSALEYLIWIFMQNSTVCYKKALLPTKISPHLPSLFTCSPSLALTPSFLTLSFLSHYQHFFPLSADFCQMKFKSNQVHWHKAICFMEKCAMTFSCIRIGHGICHVKKKTGAHCYNACGQDWPWSHLRDEAETLLDMQGGGRRELNQGLLCSHRKKKRRIGIRKCLLVNKLLA